MRFSVVYRSHSAAGPTFAIVAIVLAQRARRGLHLDRSAGSPFVGNVDHARPALARELPVRATNTRARRRERISPGLALATTINCP